MAYSIPRTLLRVGSHDQEVVTLQRLLAQKLGRVSVTSVFDYETEIAVKTFQSRMFLQPDGVVDFWTWQALCSNTPMGMPTLNQGCHGPAVEAIQDLLAIDLYYIGAVDGDFGPHTYEAVKRLQSDFQIPSTGTVDARTWQALSEI